ncbi:MAG TPA: DNA alkylation repair protein [Pyrinomonadaceae bacterium]
MDLRPDETVAAISRDLASLSRQDTPSVRRIRQQYSRSLKTTLGDFVMTIVRGLLAGGGWPERVIAFEILASHKAAFELLNDKAVEEMAEGLADWGSIDLFGVTVLGQAWREGLVSDRKIQSWARSQDRWKRRLALVATVPLNSKARGGSGDARRTLRVCRLLVDDRDDMVVKGMSWALRELAKTDPASVKGFLKTENGRLASRIRREVRNKLTTGLKTPKGTGRRVKL